MESFKTADFKMQPGSKVFIRLLILLKFVRHSYQQILNNLISFISCQGNGLHNLYSDLAAKNQKSLYRRHLLSSLTFFGIPKVYNRTVVQGLLNTSPGFFFLFIFRDSLINCKLLQDGIRVSCFFPLQEDLF